MGDLVLILTEDFNNDPYLILFLCFTCGVFFFRAINTFLEKGKISTFKYWSRSFFRYFMFLMIIMKLVMFSIQLDNNVMNNNLFCWLEFGSNVCFIIALIMLSQSFRNFSTLCTVKNKIKRPYFRIISLSYFSLCTIVLILSTVFNGNSHAIKNPKPGKEKTYKIVSQVFYVIFQLMSLSALLVFITIPMLTSLIYQFKNQFGKMINIIFISTAALSVAASIFRIWYAFNVDHQLPLRISRWVTAIVDIIISMQQTLIDHIIKKHSNTLLQNKLESSSGASDVKTM